MLKISIKGEIKNVVKINSSELILVYYSKGNGGIGDGETFAYAIGKNHCEQFDLGIDLQGEYLKKFLPSNAIEITNINDLENYEITLNDDSIVIEKNKQYIYKKKHNKNYINVELKKCYLTINNWKWITLNKSYYWNYQKYV